MFLGNTLSSIRRWSTHRSPVHWDSWWLTSNGWSCLFLDISILFNKWPLLKYFKQNKYFLCFILNFFSKLIHAFLRPEYFFQDSSNSETFTLRKCFLMRLIYSTINDVLPDRINPLYYVRLYVNPHYVRQYVNYHYVCKGTNTLSEFHKKCFLHIGWKSSL